jgi:hypothetical protein
VFPCSRSSTMPTEHTFRQKTVGSHDAPFFFPQICPESVRFAIYLRPVVAAARCFTSRGQARLGCNHRAAPTLRPAAPRFASLDPPRATDIESILLTIAGPAQSVTCTTLCGAALAKDVRHRGCGCESTAFCASPSLIHGRRPIYGFARLLCPGFGRDRSPMASRRICRN